MINGRAMRSNSSIGMGRKLRTRAMTSTCRLRAKVQSSMRMVLSSRRAYTVRTTHGGAQNNSKYQTSKCYRYETSYADQYPRILRCAYFLLDFFILTVYAITSLFLFVNVKMNDKQPANPLENVRVQTDKETLKSKYPRLSSVTMAIMWLSIGGMIVYELEPISKVIKKVLPMLANLF